MIEIHHMLILFQVIQVNNTLPCFMNYTHGINSSNIWQQCGMQKDFITASLVGWQYITGGNFSMILAAILCAFTYIKYHKIIYPMLIGVMMLPVSYFVFPATFINYAIIMAGVGVGVLIWYIFVSQSNES